MTPKEMKELERKLQQIVNAAELAPGEVIVAMQVIAIIDAADHAREIAKHLSTIAGWCEANWGKS
jgi:hypothetical protein